MLKECHLCKNRSSCMLPELNEYAVMKCRLFNPIDPQTNADRIRQMTDEELAEFLWSIGNNPATGNVYLAWKLIFFSGNGNGWLDWLRQEATP